IPGGRQEYLSQDTMSPDMLVRFNASVDTAQGIITWQFTSIDPLTGDLPVFEGFLPPNVSKPDGEGGVSFSIRPWSFLPDASKFENRASIYFDQNEPIATNTWVNTLDILPPSS